MKKPSENKLISLKKINSIFKIEEPIIEDIEEAVSQYNIPIKNKSIDLANLSRIGRKVGFFSDLKESNVMTFFTTKGGVLKTTLALNTARAAAISGLKTIVIGLDMQGDMTNAIESTPSEEDEDLDDYLESLQDSKGLFDYYKGDAQLFDIVKKTDLDNLHYIGETPELILLNDHISNLNRREYWLSDKVISKLKNLYQLIIIDCSPSWNKLTTNALCASDLLVSPVECKINNFRNLQVFQQLISEFKDDLRINFSNIYVPTKYSKSRKLSGQIYQWYVENLDNVTQSKLPECVACEEAMALNKSVIETRPSSRSGKALKSLFIEMNNILMQNISGVNLHQDIYDNQQRVADEHFLR